jgi:hypothetical protein
MTKARCPLSLHGVIRSAYDELGGVAALPVILPHRSEGWLHASTNPDLEGRHQAKLTYEDARALTRAGAMAFAQDLAALCGMALVPIEAKRGTAADMLRRGAAVMMEAGEAASTVALACADGKITEAERRAMRSQLIDVKRATTEALLTLGGADDG